MCATFPELNALAALTALTKLDVARCSPSSTPLQLPALQHLDLYGVYNSDDGDGDDGSDDIDGDHGSDDDQSHPLLYLSQLSSCMQLRWLSLSGFRLTGPGSLVGSNMLQELYLVDCTLSSGDYGPAAMPPSPWELLFPGPGRLPHLTALLLRDVWPHLQRADLERMVACCSGLQRLDLGSYYEINLAPLGLTVLLPLRHLTELDLCYSLLPEQCSSLAQLTGLRHLRVMRTSCLSAYDLGHLASLEQLTGPG